MRTGTPLLGADSFSGALPQGLRSRASAGAHALRAAAVLPRAGGDAGPSVHDSGPRRPVSRWFLARGCLNDFGAEGYLADA